MADEIDHCRWHECVEHRIEGLLIDVIERCRSEQLVERTAECAVGRPREQACAELQDIGEPTCRRSRGHAHHGERVRRVAKRALDEWPRRHAALIGEREEHECGSIGANLPENRPTIVDTENGAVLLDTLSQRSGDGCTTEAREEHDVFWKQDRRHGYTVGKSTLCLAIGVSYRSYRSTIPLRWFHRPDKD
jgi:hypothetical protein